MFGSNSVLRSSENLSQQFSGICVTLTHGCYVLDPGSHYHLAGKVSEKAIQILPLKPAQFTQCAFAPNEQGFDGAGRHCKISANNVQKKGKRMRMS